MTIADNLNRIVQAKADIKAAIENKGVAVGDLTIDSYAEKIAEIPQDVAYNGLDFTVIGYDATLTRELNDEFNADIQYSLQKYNEWDENKTSAMNLFKSDNKLVYAPFINVSNVTTMQYMFSSCSKLTTVPLFNTQNVTTMSNMFFGCSELTTVPQFDTQNVTNMGGMFYGCSKLITVSQFDTQNVSDVATMFQNCTKLESLPLFDFSNVTTIRTFFGFSDLNKLTALGGFKDLKIDWNDSYGLFRCPNLTYESVMNVINNLYDFRANGDETTTKTIKFHSNSLALLSDDDKAIATNKGWILS